MQARWVAALALVFLSCTPAPPPAACEAAVAAYTELGGASVSKHDARFDVVAAAAGVADAHAVCVKARAFAADVDAARAEKAAVIAADTHACQAKCTAALGRCFQQDCGCGPPPLDMPSSRGALASCLDRAPRNMPRDEKCENACGQAAVRCKDACLASPLLEKATAASAATALAPAPVPAAPTGPPVALRGPSPPPRVYMNETRWQEQGVMKVRDEVQQITSGLYTREFRSSGTLTVLAYDERGAATRVVDQSEQESSGERDGERFRWVSALSGVPLVGERSEEGRWRWRRSDSAPLSKDARAELEDVGDVFDDRELFPAAPIAPGASWAPPREAVAALFAIAPARFTLEEATLRLVSVAGPTATIEGKVRFRATDAGGLEETRDGSLRLVRDIVAGETAETESHGRFTQEVVFAGGTRGIAEGEYRWSDKLLSHRDATPEDEPPAPTKKPRSRRR